MLQRSSPVPLYHQLLEILRGRIERREWQSGDRIPGENELIETHGVSRTTVRLALKELENAGLITRYRGRGTFVAQPKVQHDPSRSIADHLSARGVTPGWTILAVEQRPAPTDVAKRLGLAADTPTLCISRLRTADGNPIGHLTSWVAPGVEHDPQALEAAASLDYLRVRGQLERATYARILEAIPAGPPQTELLEIDAGTPMLRIRRLTHAEHGNPIEDFTGVYRGDRFQYHLGSTP